ncbi:MAG: hypothetical protein LBP92_09720 [Deltaproteobacteria bacterium]|jgi:hypothetical protein|nr:hypothetical protein [Deltaproteobacteria bacterium]
MSGRTNEDLAEYVLGLREALDRSSLDKFHLMERGRRDAGPIEKGPFWGLSLSVQLENVSYT